MDAFGLMDHSSCLLFCWSLSYSCCQLCAYAHSRPCTSLAHMSIIIIASFPFDESFLALDWQYPDPSQFVTSFENELSAGLLISFPCLACHTRDHQAWTLCECQNCGCLWYCTSHKRRADCRRCDPLRHNCTNIQVKTLVYRYNYGLPGHLEVFAEQWSTTLAKYSSRTFVNK